MKKTFIFAAIAAFAIFSCSRKEITEETVVPEDQPKAETRAGVSRYQKGRAVVTFDDSNATTSPYATVFDDSLIRTELGYKPEFPIEKAIRDYARSCGNILATH